MKKIKELFIVIRRLADPVWILRRSLRMTKRNAGIIVGGLILVFISAFLFRDKIPFFAAAGNDPVEYWKFDEAADNTCPSGADACNSIQNGLDLSISGNVTWKSPENCVSGSCLYFDGNGDSVTNGNSPDLTTQFTISAWVKSPDFSAQMYVMETEYGAPLMYIQSNRFFATLRNSANTTWLTYSSANNVLIDNEWNYITVTYNTNDDLIFYHNGQSVGATTHPGNIGGWASTANTMIGGRSTVWFNGYIDEPKMYQYPRSADQVKADFIKGASSNGSSAVFGAADQNYLSKGLVGYWKMDEVGVSGSSWTAVDSSGNSNNGTGAGNASVGTTAAGKFGNAGFFDGNGDYLVAGSDPVLNPAVMTLSVWVNPASGYESENSIIASRGTAFDAINVDWQLLSIITSGYPKVSFNSSTGDEVSVTGNTALPVGSWTHLVGIYDGNAAYLYVNGNLVNTTVTAITRNNTAGSVDIGQVATDGSFPYIGRIDDVRIYKRAFSPREVSQLYEWAPGPVGYWDFNENIGTTSFDKSGGGYTGTVTGADWVAGKYGSALKFNGADSVSIASPSLPGIANHITISLWQNGDASIQPQADSVFEGRDVGGTRVLNVHLPWSNGDVYWDAGPGGGSTYDRIQKTAVPANYEAAWNHWAFTKNISSGSMKIYLNGTLWHSGVGNTRPIGIPDTFRIGSYADGTTNYDGLIDDFRVYNYERTPEQIVQDMNGGHPAPGSPVGSALAHWKFDEGYGDTANNGGNTGIGSTVNGNLASASQTCPGGSACPVWTNDSKYGKGLNFDGSNDYVQVIDNTALQFGTGDFSVSAWIYPEVVSYGAGDQGTIISKNFTGFEYFVYQGNLRAYLGGANSVLGTKTLSTNNWYFVTLTRVGSTVISYIDGNVDSIGTNASSVTNAGTHVSIGQRTGSQTFAMDGTIDEVKIYNYGLTADEVKVDYNWGKAIVLGSTSTGVGGTAPDNSSSREYCVPGDTSTCAAPVGEWKFDENKGTTTVNDTSGNGNTGTMNTIAASAWVPGVKSSAIEFDNVDDYIEAGTESSLNIGGSAVTVTSWINPLNLSGNDVIAVKGVFSGALNKSYMLMRLGNNLYMEANRGTGLNGTVTGTTTLTTNKWQHAAAVYDGTNMILYLNGVQDNISTGVTGNLVANTAPFFIGRRPTASEYFGGKMDEVRVYNYARTPAQIVWDYNKGAPIAHYKMDECEGTTIYNSVQTFDDAPAGMNGTLTLSSVGTCETSGAWFNGAIGKRGASIDLDGENDYISIGTTEWGSRVSGMPAVSMSTWFNADSFPANAARERFVNSYISSGASGFLIGFFDDSGLIEVGGRSGSGDSFQSITCDFGTLSEWNHAVGVIDYANDTLQLYLNGKLCNSGTATFANTTYTIGASPSIESIGSNQNAGDYFDGRLDDVRIYNYALTSHQVKTVYNNGAVSFE